MEVAQMMYEMQQYMTEIIELYETPPSPPISLTSLVKACEIVNSCSLNGDFWSGRRKENVEFKKLQARFMLVIVREFFKIKNERPEEYVENYEDALKLLHLQQKYNSQVKETERMSSKEKIKKSRITKSMKKRKRKLGNSKSRNFDQVLNLVPERSSRKHHASHSNINSVRPRGIDLRSNHRHPNDPFPVIKNQKHRITNSSKNKRRNKSRKGSHHKSSNQIHNPRPSSIEEGYLRKSKSTFMSSGWGINSNNRKHVKTKSKSSVKLKTDKTADTLSPKSHRLKSHKSFTKMRTYKEAVKDNKRKVDLPNEIIEYDYEESDQDDNWIGAL